MLVGIPNVAILSKRDGEKQSNLTTQLQTEPIIVTLPMSEEVQERYLEIREVATGAVITVIEILSPKNKRAGEGKQAYERKRNQVLASLTHLVEIDLLRGGQPMPMKGATESDYRIVISRSDRRPSAQLYTFSLRQQIPWFPIPLNAEEEEPVLNLQAILERVYERGRYHLAIDYTQLAQPPLTKNDAEWATEILNNFNS